MGRKHKAFNRSDGGSGEIRELKDKIKRLASDKKRLISELNTLKDAIEKSHKFINKKIEETTVEDAIKTADKSLNDLEKTLQCKKCESETKLLNIPNGKIRICLNNKCKNREMVSGDFSQQYSTEEIL